MPDWAEGFGGTAWACGLIGSWCGAALLATRVWLVPDWRWPEQAALAWPLGMAALGGATVLFARGLGGGFYGAGSGAAALGAVALLALVRLRARAAPGDGTPGGAGRWAVLLVGTVPVALVAFTHWCGDWSVHHWNARAIGRGWLPLPHPSYPDFEVPYHYAIDLWAAAWRALIPADPEWVFDGLSLAGWLSCALLGARLVEALAGVGPARALVYALGFSLLGGGLAWLAAPLARTGGGYAIEAAGLPVWLFKAGVWGDYVVLGGEIVNFPLLHYFFNVPFAAGLPVSLAAIHLYARWLGERRAAHAAAAAVLLGALALAHVAAFAVLGLAFGLAALLETAVARGRAQRRGPLAGALAIGATALALGLLQGGALAPSGPAGAIEWLASGLRVETASLPLYYAATFGVPGALGLVGAWTAARRGSAPGLLLALVAAIGFCVPHLAWYPTARVDNLKFWTLAALALGLLAAPAAEGLRARLPGRAGAGVLALLLLASTATPLLHVLARLRSAPDYVLSIRARDAPARPLLQPRLEDLWPREGRAARWLREHMRARDLLLLLPARGSRGEGDTHVLAVAGRFGARPEHPGYPGIEVPARLREPRARWFERALELDPDALCEPPGLWIYARHDLLGAPQRAALARAVTRGALRAEWQTGPARRTDVVYRACPVRGDTLGRMPSAARSPG